MAAHCQTQQGVVNGVTVQEGKLEGGGDKPRTYGMAFPTKEGPRQFPVKGCSGWASTRTDMGVHFWHWHVRDTVVILEDGNIHHPQFPLCDMMVPWRSLNGSHKSTVHCKKGAERKRRSLAVEEARAVVSRDTIA